MATTDVAPKTGRVFTRKKLIELLDQDIAREDQAIIS